MLNILPGPLIIACISVISSSLGINLISSIGLFIISLISDITFFNPCAVRDYNEL